MNGEAHARVKLLKETGPVQGFLSKVQSSATFDNTVTDYIADRLNNRASWLLISNALSIIGLSCIEKIYAASLAWRGLAFGLASALKT